MARKKKNGRPRQQGKPTPGRPTGKQNGDSNSISKALKQAGSFIKPAPTVTKIIGQ